MVLQSMARLLETAGFRVITCSSGSEFLRLFDPVGRSVVVLDDSMPGLSGMELIRQLGRRGARSPIILLSAYDDPQIIDHARRAGVFDFLLKPFDPNLLVQRVRQALTSG
jgi:FixJ family two-component response regulator